MAVVRTLPVAPTAAFAVARSRSARVREWHRLPRSGVQQNRRRRRRADRQSGQADSERTPARPDVGPDAWPASAPTATRSDREMRRRCRAGAARAILLEATPQQRANRRRRVGGSASQSARCVITNASVSDTSSPLERAPAGEHLVEHAAERPDVGRACRPPCRAPVRDSCRRPCRGSRRACVARQARDRRRVDRLAGARDSPASAFARPKSSTLTVPSGRSLMLAGFRSRWTMPCSCAASSASAICRAIAQRLVERNRPARDAIGQRRPVDELEHQRPDSPTSSTP